MQPEAQGFTLHKNTVSILKFRKMENGEKILFNNDFGMVSDKRLVLNYKVGSEIIPIKHLSSIQYRYRKRIFLAILMSLLTIAGIIFAVQNIVFLQEEIRLVMIGLSAIFFTIAIFLWIGTRQIIVSVGGINRKRMRVNMKNTLAAKEFVYAVQQSLVIGE